uniref:RING-type domain-containing protein n=1 Tax=Aegilops tauschii subsp. strangulata TaxID=200361 RepID=A0A453EC73_AEGTS
ELNSPVTLKTQVSDQPAGNSPKCCDLVAWRAVVAWNHVSPGSRSHAPPPWARCICFGQEGGTTAWKETVCRHIFHGRWVERWLEMKGSCPMCRRQLLAPHADAKKDARRVDPFMSYVASFMASIPDMHSSDSFNYFRQYL